ncbi:MAG: hypothetical protein ACFFD2_01785 [Promethearchaeota archaeon]
MKKKKKKAYIFLKNEEDNKELQLLEAISNRAILEPLEKEGLSFGELQTKLTKMKKKPIKKATLSNRILRLRTAGLVRKQTKLIAETEVRSPQYRGWRISKQEDGSYEAELGFELTKNGKNALNTIRSFTEYETTLPRKKSTKKEAKKKNE